MTYRSDSNYRGNNDSASSRYPQVHSDNQSTYSDHNSTNFYDRTQTNIERTYRGDVSSQLVNDAWGAPRRYIPTNNYHDPDTFKNPYETLGQAEQLEHTRGFNAARQTYQRGIDEADGISLKTIKDDRHNDMQRLASINARESRLADSGASIEQLQLFENQRHQILENEKELNNLYYAPVNARISMGLACIRTGEPLEIMEGQRLIEEAKQKRPEIAEDPRLQNLIENAFQIGYRNHHANVRPQISQNYGPQSTRTDAPLQPQRYAPQEQPTPQSTPSTQRRPWEQDYNPPPVTQQTSQDTPAAQQPRNDASPATGTPQHRPDAPAPRAIDTQPPIVPPVRAHLEVPPPPGLPNDGSRPTRALVDNSQARISDSEALSWLHAKYQHLTIEQKSQNDRDAQKAYDQTPSSWNPMAPSWDARALTNKQDKQVEFSNGFRADLTNLFATSSQPHSYDSDFARQALITIIKNSAANMSDEAGNREISEECCAQVKELCRAGANGRAEMVDAIRIGLTESAHLPSGAKNYLMDGLDLLANDRPPAITAESAGRIALLALKHEVDNTPRLGSPDRAGESRDEITQRQIRLIALLDKFGFKSALADLQDIVKSNADDSVRQAAAKAVGDLQRAR